MPARKTNTNESGSKIRIQYYRSFIAAPKTHKTIVRSLGLRKLNQVVERPDTDAMRGAASFWYRSFNLAAISGPLNIADWQSVNLS